MESTSHVKIKLILICVLLISGIIVYWYFRNDIYLFYILQVTNPSPVEANSLLTIFLKNHYSDLVWCISIVLFASVLFELKVPVFYPTLLLFLPILSEALQTTSLIGGIFDWYDILIYLVVLSIFIYKRKSSMKKIRKHLYGLAGLFVFTFTIMACFFPEYEPPPPINYTTGVFTIPKKADDVFTKKELKKLIKSKRNLSMVLRVPISGDKVTQEQRQKNSVLYNLIEKEFAKAGFVVRDRALFAKVLEQETLDYTKIGMITETDFILELLSYSTNQPYLVNNYVDESGVSRISSRDISFKGALVEFKLISVKRNDMVGAYTFYYTPCTNGCTHKFSESPRAKRTWKVNREVPKDFFVDSAKKLINELIGSR